MWWVALVFLTMLGATILFLSLIIRFIQPPRTPKAQVAKGSEQL